MYSKIYFVDFISFELIVTLYIQLKHPALISITYLIKHLFLQIFKHSYLTSRLSSIFKFTMRQCRSLSTTEDDVKVYTVNKTGILQLNRPKVLNCLNLSMVNKIHEALREWEYSKHMVIILGTGAKAFCAGGDAKKVAETGLRGESYGRDFFRREYTLNGIIGTYRLPYIALIDGIVMGGGAGLSIHGRFRVATEKTLFAMPETKIGMFYVLILSL